MKGLFYKYYLMYIYNRFVLIQLLTVILIIVGMFIFKNSNIG